MYQAGVVGFCDIKPNQSTSLASHMSHNFLSEFSIYPMYHAASKPPKHFPSSMRGVLLISSHHTMFSNIYKLVKIM